jgi:hypothetical protein
MRKRGYRVRCVARRLRVLSSSPAAAGVLGALVYVGLNGEGVFDGHVFEGDGRWMVGHGSGSSALGKDTGTKNSPGRYGPGHACVRLPCSKGASQLGICIIAGGALQGVGRLTRGRHLPMACGSRHQATADIALDMGEDDGA